MRDRKKRKDFLIGLCVALVFMAVGFSLIAVMLNINITARIKGDWYIYIDSITETEVNGGARTVSTSIGQDKLSGAVETEFNQPGDYVVYTVLVKNDGAINAKLTDVSFQAEENSEYFEYTTDAEENIDLNAGESYSFTVTAKFKDDVTSWDGDNTLITVSNLKLSFVQTSDNQGNPYVERTVVASGNASASGTDNVTWKYYDNGELVISGSGNMKNLGAENNVTSKEDTYGKPFFYQITAQALNEIENVSYSEMFNGGGAFTDKYGFVSFCLMSDDTIERIYGDYYPGVHDMDSFLDSQVSNNYMSSADSEYVKGVCDKIPTITSITISDNITSIGDYSFSLLGYEGSLILPQGITRIGKQAFAGNSITSVVLPSSLVSIDEWAFRTNRLSSITLPNNLTTIGEEAFGHNRITSLTLPLSLTTLDKGAFRQNNIQSLIIQGSYTTFENDAFNCNKNLTTENIQFLNNPTLNSNPLTLSNIDTNGFVGNICK